jgi:hypothetical protein
MQADLDTRPPMQSVDYAALVKQTSMTAALNLCQTISGKADKAFVGPGGVVSSQAQWSRILNEAGAHFFPHDRMNLFMDAAGNEAPLLWLLHSRGYDIRSLRKRETETERQLREAKDELAQMRMKHQVLVEALTGRAQA